MIISKKIENKRGKKTQPQIQHYAQESELVSLLFPFTKQILSFYTNGC